MNSVVITGRLTNEPELRYIPGDNTAVTKFKIAVEREYKGSDGIEADFIPVVVFGKQAENCNKYLVKGQQALVKGRIQIRSWDDAQNAGKKIYVTEVIAERVEFGAKPKGTQQQEYNNDFYPEDEEDDLPF